MNRTVIIVSIFVVAACGGGGNAAAPQAPTPNPTRATPVSAVQGAARISPLNGQTVTLSVIVTGDFQNNDDDGTRDLGGFYVQQESPDADPATSEGVFVFDGDDPTTDVTTGDRVEVAGAVSEYFGETQIKATSVTITGSGVIQVSDVNLPAGQLASNSDGDAIADLEAYEGMLVRFPQKLTVSGLRFLEQYGEVRLSEGGRLYQYTNNNAPGAVGYAAHRDSVAARTIRLDDGLRSSNPASIHHLNSGAATDYSIRAGDSVTGATGNLRYSRGSGGGGDEGWRLMPTEDIVFADDNPRPGAPSVSGSIRVASFNVQNFFSKFDTGTAVCGPQGNASCRGADSAEELSRQLEKIVSATLQMDADIVGLIELENDASGSLTTIVNALNSRVSGRSYTYVDTGTIHDDAIKTGFLFDSLTIQTTGPFALLNSIVDPRFDDNRNRPALAQAFEVIATGAVVTVVVNHLKSKGSSCESNGDPNTADGQGNCNATRSEAAAVLADWVNNDPTGSGDPDVLVIGDLNAYLLEDPRAALKDAGLAALLEANPNPYSYVFDARAGAIDHAVATPSLAGQVRETIEWHINADEPRLLDYNLENGRDAGLFDPDSPYRASDHDPIIIGLDLTH
jgi:predicted extracellular nuclease